MDSTVRINVWSGPRNISTALMYSFAQRADTTVVDEPLYGHYLSTTDADEYHPHAAETLASQSHSYREVLDTVMLSTYETPVVFFKQMTHHLVNMPWDFMSQMVNVILTRDPVDMLPSYARNVEQPSMLDVGYAEHHKLLQYLRSIGQEPCVLDAKRVLLNPESSLQKLCQHVGISFDKSMLSWPAGARPEDGAWAPAWYDSVHKSTGFMAYKPKTELFPEKLKPLLAECQPLYAELAALAV
ncbi:MAG: sulfotransferase family protein [Chloroflexota bacterium]